MNLTDYLNAKNFFKLIGWLLILLGISGGFIDSLSFAETEDYLYIGFVVLFISGVFPKPLTKAAELAENISGDLIVDGTKIWEPIASDSSNFQTQKLVKGVNGILKIRPTFELIFFNLIFILIGLFALFIGIIFFLLADAPMSYGGIIPTIVGGVFLCFGVSGMMPKKTAVFNLKHSLFSKEADDFRQNRQISFVQIHGLQLIEVFHPAHRMHHNSRSHSYYSYELNLILKNSERVNLMSHGDKEAIILDAKQLAGYLSVPIWHKL